jgi:hypothetical protein
MAKYKLVLLFAILFICNHGYSQSSDYPYVDRNTATLYLSETEKFKEGDSIVIGKGTAPSGDFTYITKTLGRIPLKGSSGNVSALIQRIRWIGNSKKGFIFYLVVKSKDLDNYYDVDIKNAVASGEVLSKDPNFIPQRKPNLIADELIKLKALLDAGVLTRDEFEMQKKKLLSQ